MSGAEIPLLLIEFGKCWVFKGGFFSSDFFSEKEKELDILLPVLPPSPGGCEGAAALEAPCLCHELGAFHPLPLPRPFLAWPPWDVDPDVKVDDRRKLRRAFFGFSVSTSKKLPYGSALDDLDMLPPVEYEFELSTPFPTPYFSYERFMRAISLARTRHLQIKTPGK
ncbi:hypothetical protein EST38_g11488 [Candolleomyces aberdarensis]|uniref:Uncharacterized protein n=1 Tax=Candolleomyces aberdarensis TaxID=2316362 RepID=A0A4Q2D714_9AGAR|nr:hypothetical protein EST38_g11488 [Candolleomyces aberdarensis]